MVYEFAPLEGITDHIYRNLHRRYFPGVDRYYTPFIAPTDAGRFAPRDKREVLPENNEAPLVPQLLAKDAENFLWAARKLWEMGYREINLNLGCPSGTVVAVEVSRSGGWVTTRVIDQGPGIPAEEQGVLFQPFARTSVRPSAGEKDSFFNSVRILSAVTEPSAIMVMGRRKANSSPP